ncbi:lipopolysaccharide assembly protein LapA domain-containing protein [Carboxylicivirga sp. M1479]|uniref:lipopolysaccharide assembly protein LapA domain-containing protein n=1 Tax=Carboxylicivirga sp. M1479 TaxID=2594476 RepID=UPI001177D943|nr:LapA family protein [Carboxylicivirga sp. M1479]TRX63553.1 LapA family protein [Carboxylicivirga sp. M1479]
MKKSFWVFLLLSTALVIFSVQNAKPVRVNFFLKEMHISLAILLIIVFISGVIASASYFFIKSRKKDKNIDDSPADTEIEETNADE